MKTHNDVSSDRHSQARGAKRVEAKKQREKSDGKTVRLDLTPGFRKRLIEKMEAANVPEEARLAHLSALTGRVPQTSRRWIDPVKPGLPDLESFVLLCMGFDSDANWFLGLQQPRHARIFENESSPDRGLANEPVDAIARIETIVREIVDEVTGCEPMKMTGDDMVPAIHDGDTMFVDRRNPNIAGNGIYVVECDRRVMVRNVESRIGEGLILGCENRKYKECVVKDAAAAKRMGLKVIGKVRASIGVTRFWN